MDYARGLEKSVSNKVLTGVSGGIAEYMNIDPVLVRLTNAVRHPRRSAGPVRHIANARRKLITRRARRCRDGIHARDALRAVRITVDAWRFQPGLGVRIDRDIEASVESRVARGDVGGPRDQKTHEGIRHGLVSVSNTDPR